MHVHWGREIKKNCNFASYLDFAFAASYLPSSLCICYCFYIACSTFSASNIRFVRCWFQSLFFLVLFCLVPLVPFSISFTLIPQAPHFLALPFSFLQNVLLIIHSSSRLNQTQLSMNGSTKCNRLEFNTSRYKQSMCVYCMYVCACLHVSSSNWKFQNVALLLKYLTCKTSI